MNSHRYQPKTAANVLSHLPVHRNLSASQAALVAITPAWQSWLTQALNQKKVAQNAAQSVRLEAVNPDRKSDPNKLADNISGTLVISCADPVTATQLKHLRESVMEHLNAPRPSQHQTKVTINSLTIRLRPETGLSTFEQHSAETQGSRYSVKPSESSFRAIESAIASAANYALQKKGAVSDDSDLASALKRLANTLRGLGQD